MNRLIRTAFFSAFVAGAAMVAGVASSSAAPLASGIAATQSQNVSGAGLIEDARWKGGRKWGRSHNRGKHYGWSRGRHRGWR